MATCTKPLPRPEEPNTANLPCGKPAAHSFVLRDTHVRVNRCDSCLATDRPNLTEGETGSLRKILPEPSRKRAQELLRQARPAPFKMRHDIEPISPGE